MTMKLDAGQRGITLLVALVISILVSLLATVALKTSIFQGLMTGNFVEKNLTMHHSESAIESSLNDLTLLTRTAHADGTPITAFHTGQMVEVNTEVQHVYIGATPVHGWSLASGGSTVSWFHMTSESTFNDNTARTRTEHGYYRMNPATGDWSFMRHAYSEHCSLRIKNQGKKYCFG